jgi:hypothetical protein
MWPFNVFVARSLSFSLYLSLTHTHIHIQSYRVGVGAVLGADMTAVVRSDGSPRTWLRRLVSEPPNTVVLTPSDCADSSPSGLFQPTAPLGRAC